MSNPHQRLGLMSHLAHRSIFAPYLRRIRPPSETHAKQRHLRHNLLLPDHAFSSSCDLMVQDMCLDACLDQTLMKILFGIYRIRTVACGWKYVLCTRFISKQPKIRRYSDERNLPYSTHVRELLVLAFGVLWWICSVERTRKMSWGRIRSCWAGAWMSCFHIVYEWFLNEAILLKR